MKVFVKSLLSLLFLGFTLKAFAVPYTEENTEIKLKSDQTQFEIKLKSNPTTGYSWFLKKYDATYVELGKHRFEMPENKQLMGAPGFEVWSFKVKPTAFKTATETTLHFVYGRPWEKNKNTRELVFTISTPKP